MTSKRKANGATSQQLVVEAAGKLRQNIPDFFVTAEIVALGDKATCATEISRVMPLARANAAQFAMQLEKGHILDEHQKPDYNYQIPRSVLTLADKTIYPPAKPMEEGVVEIRHQAHQHHHHHDNGAHRHPVAARS